MILQLPQLLFEKVSLKNEKKIRKTMIEYDFAWLVLIVLSENLVTNYLKSAVMSWMRFGGLKQ